MEKTLLLIIAAQGLCTVLSRQYHFIYDIKTMSEARDYCREKYTDLASVENMEDVETLNQMADLSQMKYGTHNDRAWIGLYDDVNSWRWSLSNMSFYQDGEMDFRKWAPGQPNNVRRGELCANIKGDGSWNDVFCTSHHPAICVNLRGPSVTYVRTESLSWRDAQSYCRSHHTDLASVRSEAENQKIKEAAAGENAWIGLFKDSWKWTDGSDSTFRYWESHQPDPNNPKHPTNCVFANFRNAGRWGDFSCDFKAAFICYTKLVKKQVIRLQLKTSSSLDLNDLAVKEQILNQLKQRMKDQNADVKLRWKKQPDGQCFKKKNKKDKKTGASLCDGRH